MGLIDDLAAPTPRRVLTRRALLGQVTGGAIAVALVGSGITSLRFLRPNVLFEPPTRFKIGTPESIAVGAMVVMSHIRIYVANRPEGFVAMSAECTHLGCMTRYLADEDRIVCPCHGSAFDSSGTVIEGPAPEPLPRLTLTLESGQLVVDTGAPAPADFALKV